MLKLIKKYQVGGDYSSLPTYGYDKEKLTSQFMGKLNYD
jgi:hypothetical protein